MIKLLDGTGDEGCMYAIDRRMGTLSKEDMAEAICLCLDSAGNGNCEWILLLPSTTEDFFSPAYIGYIKSASIKKTPKEQLFYLSHRMKVYGPMIRDIIESGAVTPLQKKHTVSLWQPIETAPKDGTRVLFYGSNGVFESSIHHCIPSGSYMGDGWQNDADVTHWMPLPEPPK